MSDGNKGFSYRAAYYDENKYVVDEGNKHVNSTILTLEDEISVVIPNS